ncbi:hypothetical protein EV127DRAFT_453839 [Xylaria flabelliformis]|nr:hypothetical protein EV127DRAFT_453839 [Xylaria flabelliformis]
MDTSQLPNVSGQLVTAHNPARTDLLGMDHARCAALHNYLVHYAWIAERRAPAFLHSNPNTFFTIHGATADALRPQLDPSVAAFLATALIPPLNIREPPPFFIWASEVSNPDDIFANWAADLFDQPEDSLVTLYLPNIGQGEEFGGGVFYHQGYHRAVVFMHMDDYGFALPIEKHPELWHPLETILSNWIDLIHLGKVTASPRIVTTCVDSWDRLCDAIEARIELLPATNIAIDAAEPEQLVAPAVLDSVSVPENCFARSFLTRARRPQFRFIAPGLTLPSADAPEFAATQPFTNLPRGPQAIPPVCLFPTASGESAASLPGPLNPFYRDFRTGTADSLISSRIPAGVYSESVDRSAYDNTEEGFRLLLPYGFEGDDWDAGDKGARKSDGSVIEWGNLGDLFQHGYKPFGGDYYRPQRLERLFDHWRKLVVEGVWSVGPQGVEGSIETFREADVKWKDYVIPPTW